MVSLKVLDECLAYEQFEEATRIIEAKRTEVGLASAWQLRHLELQLDSPNHCPDETVMELEPLLQTTEQSERERAHALHIRAYTVKRCFRLAELAVERAYQAVGRHPRIVVEEGTMRLRMDNRVRARELFEEALQADTNFNQARYAIADLAYVLGDFEACAEALAPIPIDDRYYSSGLRLKASCCAAQREHAQEAGWWAALIAARPKSDRIISDRVCYALALASNGDYPNALEAFREAWRADPDGPSSQYARDRIEYLERHQETPGKAKRLAAFPTVSQKWNYCGPAVLELCLRYLNLELGQDEIADAVKRKTGTPMYEIVSYLHKHAIEARRIEADRDRLKAAIDLGLPVIVQEEYSTTSHVAVITGYDEALGTFIAQDPATHRPMLKSFEFTERAGELFGNGAVIVLGREGSALKALKAQCDAVGLIQADYLALLDEADRLRPMTGSASREEATLIEQVQHCNEAIALEPRFKLAWQRRLNAMLRISYLSGQPEESTLFLNDLLHVRTTFPSDEWPHQVHAHFLMDTGRATEAYAEYLAASLRDPGDANNLDAMGECMWLTGDLRRAEEHFLKSLTLSPSQLRAAENLAATYTRQLTEEDARDGIPPIESELSPAEIHHLVEKELETVERRAAHFSRIATTEHPENPFNHEVAGDLHARKQAWEEAAASYQKAFTIMPFRAWARWGHAFALLQSERLDQAQTALEEALEQLPHLIRGYQLMADVHEANDDPKAAADILIRGINALEANRHPLFQRLFQVYRVNYSNEGAAARMRELAEQPSIPPQLRRDIAYMLDESGQVGHAMMLLRQVVQETPADVEALYRLGQLLCDNVMTRDEGSRLVERVVELAPNAARPRIRLGWTLLERDPARVSELIAPILSYEDPFAYDLQAAVLEAQGKAPEAEEALRLALESFGALEEGLLELMQWHIDAKQYNRAYGLAGLIPTHITTPELQDRAERLWVASHRLAGKTSEIMDTLRERCTPDIPEHLAWNMYWATKSTDAAFAERAATQYCQSLHGTTRTRWRINAAVMAAKQGNHAQLDAMTAEVGDDPESWGLLCDAYMAIHEIEKANQAAFKAVALDADHLEALGVLFDTLLRQGNVEDAMQCGKKMMACHPYRHTGSERLGSLLGRLVTDLPEALALTQDAVDAAPYCHRSHWAHAITLFVTEDFEAARKHARWSLLISAGDDDEWDVMAILRALDGDLEGVHQAIVELEALEQAQVFPKYIQKLQNVAKERQRSST